MELRSLPIHLLRRLCAPVVRAGAIVFFERTLDTKVARAAAPEGYSVRLGTARDLPLLLAALPGRSERMLLERFARGDRCALVLDKSGCVAHASWVAFSSAWVPELEMTLTIHPREAHGGR